MTELLVSVRSVEEAKIVDSFQIGILDVKEPDKGGLGASDPATILEIGKAVSGPYLKSFSAGELGDWDSPVSAVQSLLFDRYGAVTLRDFQFIKVGLANMRQKDWRLRWNALFQGFSNQASDSPYFELGSVGVVYLDHEYSDAPKPTELVKFFLGVPHCAAVLFDTCHKGRDLFEYCTAGELGDLLTACRESGIKTVVAGSVSLASLPTVLDLAPDYVGVRGAVCVGGRKKQVDGELVEEFVEEMQKIVLGKSEREIFLVKKNQKLDIEEKR